MAGPCGELLAIDRVECQDPAKAGRDIEIGLAPAMDDDRKLAPRLAVENVDQPLVGIPLHGAFGGDPFRAVRSASAGRAARDIEDHGVGRRTEAANRWPLRRLRLGRSGRAKVIRPTRMAMRIDKTPMPALPWENPCGYISSGDDAAQAEVARKLRVVPGFRIRSRRLSRSARQEPHGTGCHSALHGWRLRHRLVGPVAGRIHD